MERPKYNVGDIVPYPVSQPTAIGLRRDKWVLCEIKLIYIGKHEISYGVRIGHKMKMLKETTIETLLNHKKEENKQ